MKLFGSGGSHERGAEPEKHKKPDYEEFENFDFDFGGENAGDVEETAPEEPRASHLAPRKRKSHRKLIAVLVVLAILAGGGIAAYKAFVKPPDLNDLRPTDEPSIEDGSGQEDKPVKPTDDPNVEYIDNGYRKEYRYTFLIVGLDQVQTNTDTMLVGTLDVKDKWLHVVSIPRDTLVNVPWPVKKLNTVYTFSTMSYKDWEFDNGMDGLKKAISDIMGYEPDCWALIDVEAFEKLVDAIGGVYYDVPVDMNYSAPDQDLYIDIKAGYQWLSGAEALKVVRFRSGYATADIGRIETQQDFLKSVAKQMLTLGNIPNITKVYDIYEEYVDTNLSTGNIAWFVKEFLKLDSEDITFDIMPENYSLLIPAGNGLSYCSIDIDAWLELVNEKLSPLDEPITAEDLNILTWDVLKGAESTTGVVAGGEYSFYVP